MDFKEFGNNKFSVVRGVVGHPIRSRGTIWLHSDFLEWSYLGRKKFGNYQHVVFCDVVGKPVSGGR